MHFIQLKYSVTYTQGTNEYGSLLAETQLKLRDWHPDHLVGIICPNSSTALIRYSPALAMELHPATELGGPSFGANTLKLTKKLIDQIISVREEDVLLSMLRLLEYERVTADAEGAMGLAAILSGVLPELKGKRVAVVVCSGNLPLPLLRHCLDRALVLDHRVCKFSVVLQDFPGEITKLLESIGREEVRVLDMQKENTFLSNELFTLEVTCLVETRDKSHSLQLRMALAEKYSTLKWMEQ